MRSNDPFGTCAYCKEQIMWIRTKSGKNMPVNPKAIYYRKPKENERATDKLVTPEGEVVPAIPINYNLDLAWSYGYISHFATCKKKRR